MDIASAVDDRSQVASTSEQRASRHRSAPMVWFWIGLLGAVTWFVARSPLYESGSGTGYLLGLFGGVMMLLLFLYPLRKHWRFMRHWGATKHWFSVHMLFGIGGPLLILMHSRFSIGSINAGVALGSMLLVAGSGVIGRFIYTRIHHGLYGERARLRDLQAQLEAHAALVHAEIGGARQVEAQLRSFEDEALNARQGLLGRAVAFLTLGWKARVVRRDCVRGLEPLYRQQALRQGWGDREFARRFEAARELVDTHVAGIHRVAQFATYERLFSWWHVLHVPLVYMLVLSAIAHVVAVHIY